jgi:beta-lactamase regulating signal transducer with metallopeptidase domain
MEALLHVGLGNAALAAALAGLAWLVGRCCRHRPGLAHGLWLLVLLKLITPPLVRVPLPWPARPEAGEVEPVDPPMVDEADRFCPCQREPAPPTDAALEAPAEVPASALAPDVPAPAWPDGPALLVAAWLGGAGVYWLLAAGRLRCLERLVRRLPPAPAEVQERAGALADRLGLKGAPEVWLVPGPVPPMLLAVARTARLLLPGELWGRLGEAERDALLLHELAHLRRGDPWVRRLELVVLGLYWWFPVAWWASRQLREVEEQCCDAWVVWAAPDRAGAYASLLVETVAFLSQSSRPLPAGASGAGPVVRLKRRLGMILQGNTARKLSRPGLIGLMLLGAALLPLVPAVARPEAPPAKQEAPAPTALSDNYGKRLLGAQKSCQACHQVLLAGQIDRHVTSAHHDEIVKLMDEVARQRAMLKRSEERLAQALARFERLMRAEQEKARATHEKTRRGKANEEKLRELEKKLDEVRKQMESLRKELRPAKKGTSRGQAVPKGYVNTRRFQVPIRIQPERKGDVRELILYLSRDQGKTWEIYARATPEKTGFDFLAAGDGVLWFSVAVIGRDDRQDPPDVYKAPVGQKIVIDTVKPTVQLSRDTTVTDRVAFQWDVHDENLDLQTLRVQVRKWGYTEWTDLPVKKAINGKAEWTPLYRDWDLRLQVRDRAGNHGEARLSSARPRG